MPNDKSQRTEAAIELDIPVRTAYDQWTQFESFPSFMEGVEEVRQIDDTHVHWVAEIAGHRKEWDAEIIDQQPDKTIAWRSTSGDANQGSVNFESLGAERCRIRLAITYQPEGTAETVGAALGVVKGRVAADLRRFKEFIESRRTATGAWRGSVNRGASERPERLSSARPSAGKAAYGNAYEADNELRD